jgi:hypothetical protein
LGKEGKSKIVCFKNYLVGCWQVPVALSMCFSGSEAKMNSNDSLPDSTHKLPQVTKILVLFFPFKIVSLDHLEKVALIK